ncbi:MAG: MFS transporter [Acidobacteriota bacterium]|nr:MFS transporter [Acidobacteriota bacterium]
MATQSATVGASPDRHASFNKRRIFILSVIALATAGMSSAIQTAIAGDLQRTFFDPIDPLRSAQMTGSILGVEFLGFAFTIAIGSPLLDYLGMGRLLALSSLCFLAGTTAKIFAANLVHGQDIYWFLYGCMLTTGIGWGLVETVINPLTVTLYPDEKTKRLNALHAWWPGGLIIGGISAIALGQLGLNWQIRLSVVLIPALVFLAVCLGTKFPATERKASGVTTRQMFAELGRPMFIVWFLAMFLTAATELAPGKWVDLALSRTVHMPGIVLLVYVSGLMFVMRHFAGAAVHKLSPVGLLWVSCFLGSAGLLLLSVANSPITGLLAATVWGVGVCYLWPTMLAAASERFPRGGALLMGLMGTAGTLSIYFVLPQMGKVFDNTKVHLAGGKAAFNALPPDRLNDILGIAAQTSFRYVAILPAILLLVFGAIWLYERTKGGFQQVKL